MPDLQGTLSSACPEAGMGPYGGQVFRVPEKPEA